LETSLHLLPEVRLTAVSGHPKATWR